MADILKTNYMDRPTIGYSEYIAKNDEALNAQSPNVGDRAIVLSTGKIYFCLERGTWLPFGEEPTPPTPPTPPVPTGYNIKATDAMMYDPDSGTALGIYDGSLDLALEDKWATTTAIDIGGVMANVVFTTSVDSTYTDGNYALSYQGAACTIMIIDKCKFDAEAGEFVESENNFTWFVIGLGDDFDFSIYKTEGPIREHHIELPADKQFTANDALYGNINRGYALGLTAGTQYKMTATIGGYNIPSAYPFASNYGDGIISLEGGASLSYATFYDNAYFDYEDLTVAGAPKLKYQAGRYCFKIEIDPTVSAIIDVFPSSD